MFVWISILSGLFFTKGFGSPGFIQWLNIRNEIELKKNELKKIEDEIASLENQSIKLEKSKISQEKEIRRVLGYLASDEIIFDFSSSDRLNPQNPNY